MFVKLGALALFASLASALQVTVTQPSAAAGGLVGLDVFVNQPDVDYYNFILRGGPAGDNYELQHNVFLDKNEEPAFPIPQDTPVGPGYYIALVRTDDPAQAVAAQTQVFEVTPAA